MALAAAAPAVREQPGSAVGVGPGLALAALALVQLAWGLAALGARTAPAPAPAAALAVLAAGVWAACAADGASLRSAVLAALLGAAVAPLVLLARRGLPPGTGGRAGRAPLAGLVVAALAVAALATPAVAATPSGEGARPHSHLGQPPPGDLVTGGHGAHP